MCFELLCDRFRQACSRAASACPSPRRRRSVCSDRRLFLGPRPCCARGYQESQGKKTEREQGQEEPRATRLAPRARGLFLGPHPGLTSGYQESQRAINQNESKAKKNHAHLDSHLAPAISRPTPTPRAYKESQRIPCIRTKVRPRRTAHTSTRTSRPPSRGPRPRHAHTKRAKEDHKPEPE